MRSRIIIRTEQEHNSMMEKLFEKANKNEPLSLLELEIFCSRLTRDTRSTFPICNEYRFRDYYFASLSYSRIPEWLQLSEAQLSELDAFADEWYNRVVLVTNHRSQTLQHIAKEARREIKQMAKEFSYNGYLVRSHLYYHGLKKILWMSRFIHFKIVHEYFLGYPDTIITIPSVFGEIIFNDISLSHIYTRHYAAGEKQYFPDQSFFSADIHFNSIHRLVMLVLGWITKKGIYIARPLNAAITFRYKDIYYQLYFDKTYIQKKGHKGNLEVLRVKSIFPINDQKILDTIPDLTEHVVSAHLSIFEQ